MASGVSQRRWQPSCGVVELWVETGVGLQVELELEWECKHLDRFGGGVDGVDFGGRVDGVGFGSWVNRVGFSGWVNGVDRLHGIGRGTRTGIHPVGNLRSALDDRAVFVVPRSVEIRRLSRRFLERLPSRRSQIGWRQSLDAFCASSSARRLRIDDRRDRIGPGHLALAAASHRRRLCDTGPHSARRTRTTRRHFKLGRCQFRRRNRIGRSQNDRRLTGAGRPRLRRSTLAERLGTQAKETWAGRSAAPGGQDAQNDRGHLEEHQCLLE